MKLYRISQDENTGYDTYDSAVVAAENEDQAKDINPRQYEGEPIAFIDWDKAKADWRYTDWAYTKSAVAATCIGEAVEGTKVGVIVASFNAG